MQRKHMASGAILIHLGAGVGNVVLATPLLTALNQLGFEIDVALTADYPETADLLRPWSAVRIAKTAIASRPPCPASCSSEVTAARM